MKAPRSLISGLCALSICLTAAFTLLGHKIDDSERVTEPYSRLLREVSMTAAPTSIGMNLTGVNYWSPQHAFLDRLKTLGNWNVQDSGYKAMSVPVSVDADGHPNAIPAGASRIYAMVGLDPAALSMPDRYVLTYSGKADITLASSTIVSKEPGRIVFEYKGSGSMAALNIAGIDPNNPLRDMHLVREDQVGLFQQGEIFNPAFLEKADQWSELRFMDWGNTNNSTLVSWDQRTTPDDLSWSQNSKTAAVPIETMVALANKTGNDMWINIPAMANDDYVRRTLEYVRDNLDDGIKVKVEYSNEVWNWGFGQSTYAHQQGALLWGRDANNDGRIDPTDKAEQNGQGFVRYQGYRAAQVAAIGLEVFGGEADTRLDNVLATQTMWKGLEEYIFWGIAQAGKGSAATLFDSYAVTTYFALDAADQPKLMELARSGEAGMAAAFASMRTSLDANRSVYAYQKAVADKYGLDLVAYEGGIHVYAYNLPANVQDEAVAFQAKLSNDPRMADLYTKMVADFAAAGGTSLAAFQDVATPGKFGIWGTLDSIYDTASPRYNALLAAQDEVASGQVDIIPTASRLLANLTALTPVTNASNFTFGREQISVAYAGSGGFVGWGNQHDNVIVGGQGDASLWGNGGRDTLVGGGGADKLDGGPGADLLIGGDGNDNYYVDTAEDAILELPGAGTDNVYATASYSLPANIESLHLHGTAAIDGIGNDAANFIVGNDNANRLAGQGGDDRLYGRAGNDVIRGDAGNDALYGEAGNDLLTGGAGDDTLSGGVGEDTLSGGPGRDVLYGEANADLFVFGPGDLGSTSSSADLIEGFRRSEGDRIDLAAIDANVVAAGNQAFTFIGSQAFSHAVGELRVATDRGYWRVSADINGDGVGDLHLLVRSNGIQLVSSDFIL